MTDWLLAIDQGTTGTTVALFDEQCAMRAKVNTEFRQIFPQPGWVEHDLEDIWSSVGRSITACLQQAGIDGGAVRAIGITNQRETTGLWRRDTGDPVHNAIVWQCRRTAPLCRELKQAGHEPLFRRKTGLVLDPYFSGTKLRWLLDEVAGARTAAGAGDLAFGTIDSFLVYRLTGGASHVTEVSNASRTLLLDLERLQWDPELLALLDIPDAVLPEVRGSSEIYGHTRGLDILPDGIPICGMAGDQQAALFGQACFAPGQVKCTYGTGAFVLMNTGSRKVLSDHGLLTTVAWRIGDETIYALEGSVFIAGAALQWLRDGLGIIDDAAASEALAASVDSSDGVVFVPALAGLGAPHWNPEARGLIAGLTRGTTRAHLARAALEGIALQVRDVVAAMRADSGEQVDFMRVDGGAAQNDLLLQFQSDLLSVELHRPRVFETTALGSAMLAGLAAGVWPDLDTLRQRWALEARFEPVADAEQVQAHLDRWNAALEKA
jgi:glycerol kinase